MITFFALAANRRPLSDYLENWGKDVRNRVALIAYEDVPDAGSLPEDVGNACVFMDADLMSRGQAERAESLYRSIAARESVRLLNRPSRSMGRYDLLRALHSHGFNDYAVHRLGDRKTSPIRYPAFVRHATLHQGAATRLLEDARALEWHVERLRDEGASEDDLLVVEYLDTSDDGLFRKYAATRFGDTLIAHHIMFERRWMVKGPSLADPAMIAEERAFQRENPHRERLLEVFTLAGIEYGRIDYAILGGRVQIWEINTNPTLLYPPDRYTSGQMQAKRWFAREFNRALMKLAGVG